jgi:hypothetical protein
VAGITADLGEGEAGGENGITVTGALTDSGEPVTFGFFAYIDSSGTDGKPYYEAANGTDGISWDGSKWTIYREEGPLAWESSDDVATPDLCTTWTPVGDAGGTPVLVLGTGGGDAITLTCATAGASIYYTTDGTYPTPTNGTLYTAPFAAPELGTTIRAAGYKTGLNPGDCLEFTLIDRTPDGTLMDGDLALADADGTILTDL